MELVKTSTVFDSRISSFTYESTRDLESQGLKVIVYNHENSDPIEKTGIFESSVINQLAQNWAFLWGMPPYNEGTISTELAEQNSYDAPLGAKLPLQRVHGVNDIGIFERNWRDSPLNLDAKHVGQQFVPFWSPARTRKYLEQDFSQDKFTSILTFDNKGTLISWCIGYEISLENLEVVDPQMEIKGQKAFYFDTIGFSKDILVGLFDKTNNTARNIKKVVEHKFPTIMDEMAAQSGGVVLTRLHRKDFAVFTFASFLGFKELGSATVDPDRMYMLKAIDKNNGSLLQIPLRLMEKNLRRANAFIGLALEEYSQSSGLSDEEKDAVNSMKEKYQSKAFLIKLKEMYLSPSAVRDMLITGPFSLFMSYGVTLPYITNNNPHLLPLFGLIEAMPGGVSSIYRLIYMATTFGIPKTIKAVKNNQKEDIPEIAVRTLATWIEGGWLLVPILKDDESSVLSRAFAYKLKNAVKDTPRKFIRIANRLLNFTIKELQPNPNQPYYYSPQYGIVPRIEYKEQ